MLTNRHATNPGSITVIHVRRWVRWWFYVGVVCGAVALANIFLRELTRAQDEIILFLGVVFWILGGLVCWALDGIKVEHSPAPRRPNEPPQPIQPKEPAALAEDLMLRCRLSPSPSEHLRLLTDYLRRWEKRHHA